MSVSPFLYDRILESCLKKIRQKIARLVAMYELFPVLDLCCGTGKQAHFVSLLGSQVFALDLDTRMLSFARKKYIAPVWICADAACLPFREGSFGGIILSFALHDKPEGIRRKILDEVRRILSPEGGVIFLDFENPWNGPSRLGAGITWLIEKAAGKEHFSNGRQFLSRGGLRSFLREMGLEETQSYDLELGCSRIAVARFP